MLKTIDSKNLGPYHKWFPNLYLYLMSSTIHDFSEPTNRNHPIFMEFNLFFTCPHCLGFFLLTDIS